MSGNELSNIFKTSLGWAGMAVSDQGVTRIVLPTKDKRAVEQELRSSEFSVRSQEMSSPAASRILTKAVKLLGKYFSGESVSFDVPLDLRYHTPFQRSVWMAAADIPPGETRSYGWVAKRIGKPKAARAVGQALGANPIPVIIPCHRVISSSGAMGGYSGGLGMKEKLLSLESKHIRVLQRTQRARRPIKAK